MAKKRTYHMVSRWFWPYGISAKAGFPSDGAGSLDALTTGPNLHLLGSAETHPQPPPVCSAK